MVENIDRPLSIPTDKKDAFRQLTRIPVFSWPVVTIAIGGIFLSIITVFAALLGNIPYGLATVILAFIFYWFFSVIHDAAHRSITQNKKLNDLIGQLVISLVLPYANLELLRWAHIEHHRFTNEKDSDPDYWSHGAWYTLPFRWATIDMNYALRLFQSNSSNRHKLIRNFIPYLIFGLSIILLIIATGYGAEYFWLSFLPSRIMFMAIGFTFFWLPHNHWSGNEPEYEQKNNYSMATSIRRGKEWLMNLLLQYQNYHLVHHMWPTTPFYNNEKVYRLLEQEFSNRDLMVAEDFKIYPSFKPSSSN